MTSRWEPGDLRTGVLVLGASAMLVAGVIWGNTTKVQDLAPLYAEFPTLTGVSTETPVLLNGYKVGHVADITPLTDSLGRLRFRVKLLVQWHPGGDATVPYRQGMRALLIPPAIEVLGTAILKLQPASGYGAPLSPGATLPLLPYTSPLEGAQVRIDSMAVEMAQTLADTRRLLNSLVATANAATLTAKATTGVATTAAEQLTLLAGDTRLRMATADSLMRDMRSLTPSAKATADSLQTLMGDSRKAIVQMTRMVNANAPQLQRTLASLDTTSALLQHFMRQVSARPLRVLTGVEPMAATTIKARP
jgi:ABC-type transporter Mla subunit MlaD